MRFLSALLLLLVACDDSTPEAPNAEGSVVSAPAGLPIGSPAIAGDVAPDAVVATWDGGQITYGELHEKLKAQLIQMESEYLTNRYAAESSAVEQMMIEQMLETEAKKRGMDSIEALLKIEVEDKVSAPTEAEIQEFYTVMQRQLRGAPLESVREQVVTELVRRKQAEIAQVFITQIKEAANGSTALPYPDLPRVEVSADDDPRTATRSPRGRRPSRSTVTTYFTGNPSILLQLTQQRNDGRPRQTGAFDQLSGSQSTVSTQFAQHIVLALAPTGRPLL